MPVKVVCNQCGKEAPKIKDKSNKNWDARDTSKPCSCGGKFVAKF